MEQIPEPRRPRRTKQLLLGLLSLLLVMGLLWLIDPEQLEELLLGEMPVSPASGEAGSLQTSFSAEESGAALEVYFLDVGQGDSELIRFHNNGETCNMLIDTGEYKYADGLTEALRSLGVERIDLLILSHPHTDHMGCAARIVQRFEIGALYMPRVTDAYTPTTSAYEALLNAVEEKGLTVSPLRENCQLPVPENSSVQVFAPREDADWDDLNNWSAVLRLTCGETSFLFTGDAETASEKLILEDAQTWGWDLKCDVLKCGHHGSKTSSSAKFLKAVLPAYAVISCGAGNDYGHPHDGTLEKLEKLKTVVYRTDQQGTVLAKSDGKTIVWETGLPSVAAKE